MTKVGQKKADKTEAVTSATTGPELTTAATLGSEFKMSGASVTKHLENAKVPVASTMVSGKRNFVFYDKAKATAAIKAQIAEKTRLEAEKARAKEAAKQRAVEKSESKPAEQSAGAVPGDVSRIAANVGALQDLVMLHQDIATKQFDLLNMKADRLEKKQVNLDKDVLAAAVKTAMGDGLATVTSAIRRQREDADKEFNAQRLAVEAQFVKVTSQLDNLLQRVSALTDVVGALENTILAIHTAPEPQAPIAESNKSGEANQEQHFFFKATRATSQKYQRIKTPRIKTRTLFLQVLVKLGANLNRSYVMDSSAKAQTRLVAIIKNHQAMKKLLRMPDQSLES